MRQTSFDAPGNYSTMKIAEACAIIVDMTIPDVTNPALADLPSHVLWLDLETTGLDPQRDNILEVAASLAAFSDPFDAYEVINTPVVFVRSMHGLDPFVVEMHTRNGLFAACAGDRATPLAEVERSLCATLAPIAKGRSRIVLGGSTVHFDLAFLRVHMPKLAALLAHRTFDVSSLKLFCNAMGMPPFPKAEAHRASADVVESIEHARACEEWLRDGLRADVMPARMFARSLEVAQR